MGVADEPWRLCEPVNWTSEAVMIKGLTADDAAETMVLEAVYDSFSGPFHSIAVKSQGFPLEPGANTPARVRVRIEMEVDVDVDWKAG